MRRLLTAAVCTAVAVACSGSTGPDASNGGGNGGTLPHLAYEGTFHPVVHNGMGHVSVYVTTGAPGGEVRFGDMFATDAGGPLEVWLVSASDPMDNASVLNSSYVSLGPLKSLTGPQNYTVPDSVNLSNYHAVTVWCVSAQANFTSAPLMMP